MCVGGKYIVLVVEGLFEGKAEKKKWEQKGKAWSEGACAFLCPKRCFF